MKKSVFKDATVEILFQKNGFVVLPLLTRREANELLEFYETNPNVDLEGFHATHFSKNRTYKKKVQHQIVSVFESGLNKVLNDYEFVFANFMVKEMGINSSMPLHADWTYLDETQNQSLGIWCPLVDTNERNGMLGVIPFSHRLKTNSRGPKILSPFIDFNDYIIKNYGSLLKIKAGYVVIYDHRLLHFSHANISSNKRVSINIAAVPKDIEVVHYAFFESKQCICKYEVSNSDFFIEYNHFEEPDNGRIISTFDMNILPFEKDYIDSVLKTETTLYKLKQFFRRK